MTKLNVTIKQPIKLTVKKLSASDMLQSIYDPRSIRRDVFDRANHTGTQLASTISDFNTAVRTNRLDQMASPTSSVSMNGQRLINLGSAISGTDGVTLTQLNAAIAGVEGSDVDSFNGRIGDVLPQSGDYTKAMVGLGNVDNTSDLNKSLSTATISALSNKLDLTAISDSSYSASWDSDTLHAPSKNAIYDKFEGVILNSARIRSVTKTIAPTGVPADKNTTGTAVSSTDAAVIQTADAEVVAAGGGKLLLRPGTYYFENTYKPSSNVTFEMEKGALIIPIAGSAIATVFSATAGVIQVLAKSKVTLSGIRIDGSNIPTNGLAVYISESSDVEVDHAYIYNNGGFGVFSSAGFASSNGICQRVTIHDSYIQGVGHNDQVGGGKHVATATVDDVKVYKNTVIQDVSNGGTYSTAIDLTGVQSFSVDDNRVWGSIILGTEMYPNTSCSITNNRLRYAPGSTSPVQINANTSSFSNVSSGQVVISHNIFEDPGQIIVRGIAGFILTNFVVTDNILKSAASASAMQIIYASQGVIEGNVIDTAVNGIQLQNSSNVQINTNVFSNMTTGINDQTGISSINVGSNNTFNNVTTPVIGNYIDMPSVTPGNITTISAKGSDPNVSILIKSQGSGSVLLRPGSNSTTAVRIQTASGGTTLATFDTTNIRVGFLNQTPTIDIGINGSVARTMGLERNPTAGGVGQQLTLQAGGADNVSPGTDQVGGNLILQSGLSTGTGNSSIQFKTPTPSATSGITANTYVTRLTLSSDSMVIPMSIFSMGSGGSGENYIIQFNNDRAEVGYDGALGAVLRGMTGKNVVIQTNGATTAATFSGANTTFAGTVTLSADPTLALQASTKQYTDTQNSTRVAKTGDTMTGVLVVNTASGAASIRVASGGAGTDKNWTEYTGGRAQVGYDGGTGSGVAYLQGGSGKGLVLFVNSTTAALSFDGSGISTFGNTVNAHTITQNAGINFSSNQAGGITRNLQFTLNNQDSRPWLSWVDEFGRQRVGLGYHSRDIASGNFHNRYEIKTSDDPAGATPANMATRFYVGTDAKYIDYGMETISRLILDHGEYQADTAFGIEFRSGLSGGGSSVITGQIETAITGGGETRMLIQPQPTTTNAAVSINFFRETNTTSTRYLNIFKGDNTNSVTARFSGADGQLTFLSTGGIAMNGNKVTNQADGTVATDSATYGQLTTGLAGKEPTITAGTTAQYWRGDKTWQTLNTTNVPEGTNLYYTDTRADARIANAVGTTVQPYSASTTVLGNATTGTGAFVLTNSPTIVTPTVASFANANHNHTNSAGGGQLTDAALSAAVGITKGGTGQTTANAGFNALSPMTTAGDIIYGGAAGAGTRLAAGTSAQVLIGGTTPSWGAVSLTTMVSGVLPIANGGTGSATQNFVDLTTNQTVAGIKTFSSNIIVSVASGVAGLKINGAGTASDSNSIEVTGARAIFGYDGTSGNAYITAGSGKGVSLNVNAGTQALLLTSAANALTPGYLRVGSVAAPTNTTAGDLTAVRLSIGNGNLGSAGQVINVSGTMTNTASGAQIFASFTNTISPTANSLTDFRALNYTNRIASATGVTINNVTAGYFENRIGTNQDSLMSNLKSLYGQGIVLDSTAGATSSATSIWGAQLIGASRVSGTTTLAVTSIYGIAVQAIANSSFVTATSAYGIRVDDAAASNTITNSYGIDVAAVTSSATNNVGVRIGEALGGSGTNYTLQLSGTSGNPSSGITFASDTQLYRNAANSFTMTGRLILPAGTTTLSSIRIPAGVAPTTPTNGDMWQDGTHMYGRINGATYQLDNSNSNTPVEVTGTTQAASVNIKYYANNAARVVFTLPTTAAQGDQVSIRGKGAGGWRLGQNASQVIHGATDTTTGTGGYLESQTRYDVVVVECITANTEWEIISNRGTLTVV